MALADVVARREARLIRGNGTDIAYRDVGNGPPLVLLHGALASTGPGLAGSSSAHVDHLADLARHFRVIAPDTRGSGATIHPGGPITFDVLSEDVVAFIQALGLDRPLVAGFSEGGATATLVALRYPGVVSAVVNHAGFDYFDPSAVAHQSLRPIFGGSPDAAERTLKSMSPVMADTFNRMKADYGEAQGEDHWRSYLSQFFDRSAAPFGYAVADLAALHLPTLILAGDRDMFCTVEAACAAYRTLPAGELGIVPNTDHAISASVVDSMIGFLLRHT